MKWTARRERYRAILAGDACIHPASVFDPISARIAEDLGFEACMFAGSTASLTVLGAPDILLLTLTEFADQAGRICRAGELPLMVDADHGYGNALNVMRTVEELETAGISALTIEDTDLPPPFGSRGKSRLLSRDEGIGKIRAALAARRDPNLSIIGRTSAPLLSGFEDAVARCRAYAQSGCDAIFIIGLRTLRELEMVRDAVRIPLVLGELIGELTDRRVLEAAGVRVALQGHQPFRAAVAAVHATMNALRSGTPPTELEGLAPAALMAQLTRAEHFERGMASFLEPAPSG